MSTDPNAIPGDEAVAPASDSAPADATPTVEAPVNVVAPDPATDDAPVVPGPADAAPVEPPPAAEEPLVEPVTVDNAPATVADVALEVQAAQTVEPAAELPSLATVNAQALADSGLAPALVDGAPVAPAETADGHTVDATGTADDWTPGVAPVNPESTEPVDANDPHAGTDVNPRTVDQRVALDDRNIGVSTVSSDVWHAPYVAFVEQLAEAGVKSDLLKQWVTDAYANLDGQRRTAQTDGRDDPFPLYVG